MIKEPERSAVIALHKTGMSIRQIAKKMKMGRKTVRKILDGKPARMAPRPGKYDELLETITQEFHASRKNVALLQQRLETKHAAYVPYTSLTRIVRELGLRESPIKRSGSFVYPPGKEAQHDTSPHNVVIGDKKQKAQCAAMALSCSRRLFMQYYPRFSRFEARLFLTEAFKYFDGVPFEIIIDNTSVVLAGGSGADAVIAPAMESLARIYETRFVAHEIGHADRKAIVERNFHYIENNFLPGRKFDDWEHLNREALKWCDEVANQKIKRALQMSANQAFAGEKPYLQPLPAYCPPIYESLCRVVDLYGYVNVDTNRYSVPERYCTKSVEVHKSAQKIRVYCKNQEIACHARLIGQRDAKSQLPGHHSLPVRKKSSKKGEYLKALSGHSEQLDRYVALLKTSNKSFGLREIKRLLNLKRSYPATAFDKAIDRALQYGLFDLGRLERMILSLVAGDFFNLGKDDDES